MQLSHLCSDHVIKYCEPFFWGGVSKESGEEISITIACKSQTTVEELQGTEEQVGEEAVSADKPKKSWKQTKVPVGLD